MAPAGPVRHTAAMDTTTDRDLDIFLDDVRAAPRDAGSVVSIILRPGVDLREEVDEGILTVEDGLVGDDWRARASRASSDRYADANSQLTLMSTRVLAAICPDRSRWPLAGDQVLVDLDLSEENLPPGTRLTMGDAEVEVTPLPHTGCAKFSARFGSDALRWINNPTGRALRMRGMYVRVVRGGTIHVGDTVRRA